MVEQVQALQVRQASEGGRLSGDGVKYVYEPSRHPSEPPESTPTHPAEPANEPQKRGTATTADQNRAAACQAGTAECRILVRLGGLGQVWGDAVCWSPPNLSLCSLRPKAYPVI